MNKESQLRLLRKAFSDISRGYSVAFFKGTKLFIKHLSHHEQVSLDVLYKNFLEDAKKEGLPTEEYMTNFLKEEGVWTAADDKEIADIQTIIERLVNGKKVIYLKADLERQNKDIQEHQNRFHAKKAQKEKLLGLTAEAKADKKVNEHYIVESFFTDSKCAEPWLKGDIFENLSEQQMQDVVRLYNTEMETVSDKNIKHLALQDFFQIYWSLSTENLHAFFGRPICDLTYFQVKLGSYGRMFKNILEKANSFPEEIRNDPDKILDYVRAGENAKEHMEKAAQGSPSHEMEGTVASTLFGAKEQELKEIGIQSDPGASTLSFQLKKAKAEGKKGLNMMDMMAAMGV